MDTGTVVLISLAASGGEATVAVEVARAVAGEGLEGDRYLLGVGTFSKKPGTGRQITLIESEAVDDVARTCPGKLAYADARRNLVTRGAALNDLIDKEFRVGDVRLRGVRLCDPCRTAFPDPEVKQALTNRGGLRADILSDGVIRVGDTVIV